jgi:hypothetical protein
MVRRCLLLPPLPFSYNVDDVRHIPAVQFVTIRQVVAANVCSNVLTVPRLYAIYFNLLLNF